MHDKAPKSAGLAFTQVTVQVGFGWLGLIEGNAFILDGNAEIITFTLRASLMVPLSLPL